MIISVLENDEINDVSIQLGVLEKSLTSVSFCLLIYCEGIIAPI